VPLLAGAEAEDESNFLLVDFSMLDEAKDKYYDRYQNDEVDAEKRDALKTILSQTSFFMGLKNSL